MEDTFAFIIHPRNLSDTRRKYPWLKFLPSLVVNSICHYSPPLVASEITGLKSYQSGKPVKGWLLICPLTAKQLLRNRELGKRKIKKTICLAEKLGAKLVGIGALTASITSGGKDLISGIKIGITHGRAFTVGISLIGIKEAVKIKNLDLNQIKMAIVGATGSIGSAISKLLIKEGVKDFILVAKNLDGLTQLKNEMEMINSSLSIEISSNIYSIKNAQVVMVATSASEILIDSKDLQCGALVYDVTQPQNISPRILKKRKDLLIIDGGIVSTPGVDYNFNFGLPLENTFACMAETMILAAERKYDSCLVGDVQLDKVKEIVELSKKYNFTHAPFSSFGKLIFHD